MLTAFLRQLIAKINAGDLTFVEVVRYIHEWSGKLLQLIDGVPIMGGYTDDLGEANSAYCELYELVHSEPPAMEAGEEVSGPGTAIKVFLLLLELAKKLKEAQQ